MTRTVPCLGEQRRLDIVTIAGLTAMLWAAIIGMTMIVL